MAELCAQPPQELGTPSPLGHGVTTAAASAALEGRGLLALSAPGQSLSLAQTQWQWEAMGTPGPAGLSPWDGRSVGHGAAGVAVTERCLTGSCGGCYCQGLQKTLKKSVDFQVH